MKDKKLKCAKNEWGAMQTNELKVLPGHYMNIYIYSKCSN